MVIKHLINLVHERIIDGADVDPHNSTLKFALSALWNLTGILSFLFSTFSKNQIKFFFSLLFHIFFSDESPVTCENFLNEHGLPVMVKTLKVCLFFLSVIKKNNFDCKNFKKFGNTHLENRSIQMKVLGLLVIFFKKFLNFFKKFERKFFYSFLFFRIMWRKFDI